ncbi:adenylate/guanylate cyclase domain-containing protein [Microbaculum marinum]|uniref:Adenylate/guanylate cyclase domain-containing protein n=1 Tax=Microbaculum marinum TaxID=1764581 RepID=A0AAW9RQG6_9HYPH
MDTPIPDGPERRRLPRKIAIRTLLALSTGGLVLVATVAVLWIALGTSTRNTVELLNDRIVLILDGIESEVRDRLDAGAGLVDGIASEMRTDHFRAATPSEVTDMLTVVLATAPDVEVLLYWDRELRRRGVFRDAQGIYKQLPAETELDPRLRNRLASVPAGTPHVWGDPVVENGTTFLNVVARVDSDASDVAFVGAAVSLQQFSRLVASIGRSYDATAFILYGETHLLAHPDLAAAAGGSGTHAIIPVTESKDPVILNLDKAQPVAFTETARKKGVEVERLDVGDERYLILYRWVLGYGERPLAIGAYYRQEQLGESLQRLMMSGIAGLVVAVLAVIAALFIGGFVSRPVRRLAESAVAVSRLEMKTVPRPAGSPIAEIDDQARAFNMMLDGLRVFETYVPRQLVQRLIALSGGEGVTSETREVTVMFTDIASFTMISDRMGAEETAAFLNRHFGLLAECITGEGGSIDKYIGDAIMAFWGAPDRMDDHAARAVAAARRIADTITRDNERRARKGLQPVRMRIGLHTGPAVVGNIGAPGRVNYTIVGDTVNVAQRLESLGHKLDAGADVTVLMSATTARLAGVGPDGENVGEHDLAGVPYKVPVVRLHTHLQPQAVAIGKAAVPAR